MNNQSSFRKYGHFSVGVQSAESLLFDRADEFDALSDGIPFRETTCVRPWFRNFGQFKTTCFITVIDDNDRICGILPLKRLGNRGWQSIGIDLCSDHTSVMVNERNREPVTECLAEFLFNHVNDREIGWTRLHFEGVLAGDPSMASLFQRLSNASEIRIQSRMNAWFRTCDTSWEDALQTASRRQRQRNRAAIRSLEQNVEPLEVRFAQDKSTTIEYVNQLVRLHQKHWRSQGQPGSYAKSGMREFIQEAALEALDRDRLLMPALFRIDPATGQETIIAVQIHFIGDDRRMYCYSVGMDYDHAKIKPGHLLNTFLLRMAHDGTCPGIDLLRGDEEYKRRMAADPIPVLIADVFAPTMRGQLDRIRHDLTLKVKQEYRQRRGRPLANVLQLDEAFAEGYRAFLPSPSNRSGLSETEVVTDNLDSCEADFDDGPILLPFGALTEPQSATEPSPIH